MTKNQFLDELKKELKLNKVDDIDEIIEEYNDHFSFKIEEGMTEDEIAKKLTSPKEIAKEYALSSSSNNKTEKKLRIAGLTVLSIPLSMIYLIMWSSIAILGAFAVLSFVLGFCLITKLNIFEMIPSIPYFPSFMLSISMFALSILSIVGSIYIFLYVKQWGLVYFRWCKNVANKSHYPSISKQPKLSKKFSYRLKLIAIISLISFIATFTIAYFSMCLIAHSMEPWHIWHWFE